MSSAPLKHTTLKHTTLKNDVRRLLRKKTAFA